MAGWIILASFSLASVASAASPDVIGWEQGSSLRWGPCKSCEWSIRSIQDFIADPTHQEMMAEAIDSIACSFKAPAGKEFCKHDVQAVLQHTVHLFEDYVSPRSVCKPLCEWSTPSLTKLSSKLSSKIRSSYPQCPYCTFAAQQIHAVKEADVINTLQAASNSLPSPFTDQYRSFVQMNGVNVAKLVQVSGPVHACVQSGHCEVPGLIAEMSRTPVPEDLAKAVADLASKIGQWNIQEVCTSLSKPGRSASGSEECDFCKMAVIEIRDKISDPVFQSNVEKYLRTVCANLGDYKSMCVQYVDEYVPLAFMLTEEYLQPERACQMVHLCPHKA